VPRPLVGGDRACTPSFRQPSPSADVERALPFVADDYAKALAEARAQKLPLFIEAWAPW
jgi:hypothetical protein